MNGDIEVMEIGYTGEKGPFFSLALKTGLLTVITLGIYRFWQKTRIRKYIWSSVNAGGDRFEYTGTGLEKFLGFLVAVVFLAVYLGLIQMVLFYFGLNVMVDPDNASTAEIIGQMVSIYISAFAVVPLFLYALYRARRYKMARTRWRGIRLGMDKGAWGYVARALGYGALNIVSLGILMPLSTFKLEKYMADRSFFGTERVTQHGRWTELYPAAKHVLIGLGLLAVSVGLTIWTALPGAPGFGPRSLPGAIIGGAGILVGYLWLMIGFVIYSVRSFGYLMSRKTLGDEVRFIAEPRSGTVIKTYILGGLLLGVLASLVFGVVGGLFTAFIPMLVDASATTLLMFGGILAVGYIFALVLVQALSLILITQPVLAHYVATIRVVNPDALDRIGQRASETGVDAEGFADALDVGGAI